MRESKKSTSWIVGLKICAFLPVPAMFWLGVQAGFSPLGSAGLVFGIFGLQTFAFYADGQYRARLRKAMDDADRKAAT